MRKFWIIFVLIFVFHLSSCSFTNSTPQLEIHILNVGKADCIVIQTEHFVTMIDTAEEEDLPEIMSFLEQKKIQTIDCLILTHFDKDHIGGAAHILSNLNVSQVIQSTFSGDRQEYFNYLNVMKEKHISPLCLNQTYSFSSDDCYFTIYPPEKDQYGSKEDNNASLIVSVQYQENSFLFCGDAMEERLEELIQLNLGNFDFVKLPYHGNYLENYSAFLQSVSCKYGAITCSKKNPASEKTLELLEEHHIKVYQTSHGSIQITAKNKEITILQ